MADNYGSPTFIPHELIQAIFEASKAAMEVALGRDLPINFDSGQFAFQTLDHPIQACRDAIQDLKNEALNSRPIDIGDRVLHAPTGETWVVARVSGGYLYCAGWPCTRAPMSDCTLLEKASPEFKAEVIEAHKRLDFGDPRRIP